MPTPYYVSDDFADQFFDQMFEHEDNVSYSNDFPFVLQDIQSGVEFSCYTDGLTYDKDAQGQYTFNIGYSLGLRIPSYSGAKQDDYDLAIQDAADEYHLECDNYLNVELGEGTIKVTLTPGDGDEFLADGFFSKADTILNRAAQKAQPFVEDCRAIQKQFGYNNEFPYLVYGE